MSEHPESRTTRDLRRKSDDPAKESAARLVDEVSVQDIGRALIRGKKTILLAIVLTTATAALYSFFVTPIYRAEVLMVSASDQQQGPSSLSALAGQFSGIAGLAGMDIPLGGEDARDVEVALAVLQSRRFTEEYIREHNLMPVLFSDSWDQQKGEWKKPGMIGRLASGIKSLFSSPAGKVVDDDGPTVWDAYKMVREEILSVETNKANSLIRLSIDWQDPELATEWANNAVARVNDHIRRDDVIQAEKSIRFLNEQLENTMPVEVQQALYSLIREQTKVIMLANAREEYVFKVIDPAVIPQTSIRPRRVLIIVLGIFLGLTLGALIVVPGAGFKNQGSI